MNAKIKTGSGFVQLSDQRLFYKNYRPEDKPRAILVLVHGLAEHSGRYEAFAGFLAEHGYSVTVYDQRGHGKTPGPTSDVPSFQALIDDVRAVIDFAKKQEAPGTPCFVMGHSFGGQVVVNYLAQHRDQVQGAILSSPNLKLALQVPWLKRHLGRLLSRFLPTLTVPNDVDPEVVSHDPEIVRAYREDPMVSKKISLRFGAAVLENLDIVGSLAEKIETPCLVFQGSEDQITSAKGSEEFFQRIKTSNKKWILYPNFYHETLNEIGKERVYRDVLAWLASREGR